MKNLLSIASLAVLAATSPLSAQEAEKPKILSPGQIVDQAAPEEWKAIAADDLLIMDLGADAAGKERKIIFQLIPPPFSQGWVRNIRKLAKANWWDGTSINRVQDNYVVQWGDPAEEESERKPLPEGLEVMTESDYVSPFRLIQNQWKSIHEIMYFTSDIRAAEKAARSEISSPPPQIERYEDDYESISGFALGWPVAQFWPQLAPVHCYGALGVGRGLTPDTGSGAELYTVIGHAPRHLDRNIAVVGRVIEGMHHLSSLPRGFGPLGFYETPEEQVPVQSFRLASELPKAEQPRFEYLDTASGSFSDYAHRRANREPPFFIKPAGGADICNIPVPVRRIKAK